MDAPEDRGSRQAGKLGMFAVRCFVGTESQICVYIVEIGELQFYPSEMPS